MTYRTRTLLQAAVGLLLIVALSLWAYFDAYRGGQEREREQRETRQIMSLDPLQVVRLELERDGQRTVAERAGPTDPQPGAWRLIAPVHDEADRLAIEGLLGTVDRLQSERVIVAAESGDRSAYGLDPPRARVALVTGDGRELALLVGKKSGFDESLYVQREDGQDVLVVAGHLEGFLLKTAFDLRRKEVIRFEKEPVRGLTLSAEGRRSELLKKDGAWTIVSPLEDRADQEEVDRLLDALRSLRAVAFPAAQSASPRAYGLDPPAVTAELVMEPEGARLAVAAGRGALPSNQGKVYARLLPAGSIAEIQEYQLANLQKSTFDLQAKAPLEFAASEVFKVKLAADRELIVLEKRPEERPAQGDRPPSQIEAWSLVSPRAVRAKDFKVASLLSTLARLRAVRFAGCRQEANLAARGLDLPRRTVTLYDSNDKELATLQIGKRDEDGTYVLGTSREQVCLVNSREIDRLPDTAAELEEAAAPAPPTTR